MTRLPGKPDVMADLASCDVLDGTLSSLLVGCWLVLSAVCGAEIRKNSTLTALSALMSLSTVWRLMVVGCGFQAVRLRVHQQPCGIS